MTLVPAGYVPVPTPSRSSPDVLVPESMPVGEVLAELGRPASDVIGVVESVGPAAAPGTPRAPKAMDALRVPIGEHSGTLPGQRARQRAGKLGADLGAFPLDDPARYGDPARRWDPARGGVELSTVGGLDAGAMVHLEPGIHRLPSGTLLEVTEDGPQGGPWAEVAGRIEALPIERTQPIHGGQPVVDGLCVRAVSPPIDLEPSRSHPFRRPPRTSGHADHEALRPPEVPPPLGAPNPLSWASLLAPLPIALAMAFFFRPLFALFALMGPVLVLGRWFEQRRRRRTQSRDRSRAVAAATAEVARAVRAHCDSMERGAWAAQPHVAHLLQRARQRSVRTWERRLDDDDRLRLMLGVGPRWVAPVWASPPSPELGEVANAPVRLRSAPFTIDLLGHGGLGTFGDLDAGRAVLRSLVLQLTTLRGPADLVVGIIASDQRRWDWIKWLPHVDPTLVATPHAPNGWAQLAGRAAVMIVDDAGADVASLVRAAADAEVELTVLSSAEQAGELPAACSLMVEIDAGGRLHGFEAESAQCPTDHGIAVGISVATATEWARALAGFVDPELEGGASNGLADAPTLPELLDVDGVEAVVRANVDTAGRARSGSLPFVLGVDRNGTVAFDLVADGPHALVAGTTGSGKSELLRTMVLAMAAVRTPDELSFVLADFKGGGAFDGCAELPHVAGFITDLDTSLVERALAGLRAEVRDREERLRRGEGVGRLVVVIDEFAVLAQEYPSVLDGLIDLAARGRSLGMHLVLATQKPSGVVDHRIRANTNLRIALRVQHPTESHDVVGVADAADLDRRRPGRSIVRVGSDDARVIQVARTTARTPSGASRRMHPFVLRLATEPDALAAQKSPGVDAATTDAAAVEPPLDRLARWIATANAGSVAPLLWTPPLPARLGRDAVAASVSAGHAVDAQHGVETYVIGVADHAATRVRRPHIWRPSEGGLVLFSSDLEPMTHLIDGLLADIVGGAGLIDHAYVIGPTSSITTGEHGCIGAVVASADRERIERLLTELERGEAHERSSPHAAQVLLAISDIGSMLASFDDLERLVVIERLEGIARRAGPGGLHLVVGARSVRDLPHRVAQHIRQRLLGRVADPTAHLLLGTTPVGSQSPMHVVDIDTDVPVVLCDGPEVPPVVIGNPAIAPPIGRCPKVVPIAEVGAVRPVDGGFDVDLGIRYDDLAKATLPLRGGRAVLVAGPPGSGRTNVVRVIEGLAQQAGVAVQRIGPDTDPQEIPASEDASAAAILLVDDADRMPDEIATKVRDLVERQSRAAAVIIATTIEGARAPRSLGALARSSGTGLLIGGGPLDGEIFRIRRPDLPGLGHIAGRATLVVAGRAVGIQVAIDPRSA